MNELNPHLPTEKDQIKALLDNYQYRNDSEESFSSINWRIKECERLISFPDTTEYDKNACEELLYRYRCLKATIENEIENLREQLAAVEENGVYGPLDSDTPVSMNFWGLMPKAIELLGDIFKEELPHGIETNPIKYEALLPNHIGYMVRDKKANVRVLRSEDSWMGVTYKEDKPIVQEKINALKDSGAYPFDLWKK